MLLGVLYIGIFVLIFGGFLLNGYIMFLLWYVFVIFFNGEDIKNN